MLVLSESARADMKEIWSYIAESNIDSANNTIRELARKFDLLEANPKLGRRQDSLLIEMRLFPHKNYNVFYFPIEGGVEIYRVLHARRQIEEVFEDFFGGLKE